MNFSLVIGDNLEAALRTGLTAESRLELKLQRPVQTQVLRLRLNGEVLTGGIPGSPEEDECRYPVNFPVGAPPLRMGENRIEVSFIGDTGNTLDPVDLCGLRLWIDYQQKKSR